MPMWERARIGFQFHSFFFSDEDEDAGWSSLVVVVVVVGAVDWERSLGRERNGDMDMRRERGRGSLVTGTVESEERARAREAVRRAG